ncbi:MFS transporter [Streptomyces viridifaciens]|nr:MFS transporter [Streptomyces viridifaciens]UKZ05373.1 MFS transporter [Streptomyces viridifaciens]
MTAPTESAAPVPLRRNRDFLLLWTGNWLQFFGSRLSGVCYPLLALGLSGGSARMAGYAATAAVLPYLLFQLPAGVLVDGWDRRRVMQLSALGRLLVLVTVGVALVLDRLDVRALVVLIGLDVSCALFSSLAERASIPVIVPASQLRSAMAQNEARGRVAGLVGGPIGTVLYTWTKSAPYFAAAVGAVVAAVNVRFIRTDCRPPGAGTEHRDVRRELLDGLDWVRRHRFLRVAIPLVSASSGLLQVVSLALVVVLVKEQGHDPDTVGLLVGISGCGGAVGALTARWWMGLLPFPVLLVGGFAVWSALIAGMAFVTGPLALGMLFGAMNLVGAVFGVATAVYQLTATPAELQGRVASIAGLLTAAGPALGAFASGHLLDRFDGSGTMLITAGGMAVVALSAAAVPAVRQARPAEQAPEAGPTSETDPAPEDGPPPEPGPAPEPTRV